MSAWINLAAVSKILIFGLLVGASAPTLFALGVRLHITNSGAVADGQSGRARFLVRLSWAIFALVLVVVITGVLFIANDFIGHHTGLYLFGSRAHGE